MGLQVLPTRADALTPADILALSAFGLPVAEKAAADHFYGAWHGGKKAAGGGAETQDSVTVDDAMAALERGERPTIDKGDVASFVDAAAKRDDHLDLTELHVNGTAKFGLDGLGIARKDMPQLPSDQLPKYLADLKTRGVSVTTGKIKPQRLKPIQKEVSATNSSRIALAMRNGEYDTSKTVVISKDHFVLDGHHRWGAATAYSFEDPKFTLPYVQIGLPAKQLLRDANRWTAKQGIAKRALGESVIYDDGVDIREVEPTLTGADWLALAASGHPIPAIYPTREAALPRSAFAYAPGADPDGWLLPIYKADGTVDPDGLPRAVEAIEGSVPKASMGNVKSKLRQAYRRLHGSEVTYPEPIREAALPEGERHG